jgi:hypothetical protein
MQTAYVRWQAVLEAFRSSRAGSSAPARTSEPPPALPAGRSAPASAPATSRVDPSPTDS